VTLGSPAGVATEAEGNRKRSGDAPEHEGQREQGPGRHRRDVGREARPEQRAVEEERARQRHRASPGLRNLKTDLGLNASPRRVGNRGDRGQSGSDGDGGVARIDRGAGQPEGAEHERGPEDEPEGERRLARE
jgi:hypothetical protein